MITQSQFAILEDKPIYVYRLTNKSGASVTVTNFGATITAINVPDRAGKLDDVVLGHEDMNEYISQRRFFGSSIGRFANRIADGRFTLNGIEYHLDCNNNTNHLHGGYKGFDRVVWDSEIDDNAVVMHYLSPDKEEKYPGTVDVSIRFLFDDENALTIDYQARSDRDTIINLTNHSFFNLNGGEAPILKHTLKLNCDHITPVDDRLIPTGEIAAVAGTPFDFTTAKEIGDDINANHPQLSLAEGYDHNFVINGEGFRLFAELYDPTSGRKMIAYTDKPAVQLYTCNKMNNVQGKNGKIYNKNYAVCLETQFYPDTPNHPEFPSCILREGEQYHYTTKYLFQVEKV
jgi:aldose 1-epimerase